jgi:glycosyltransferase involved in cell wall biosynthesis
VRGGLPVEAKPVDALAGDARGDDVVVYEHAIGSPVVDVLVARHERLVVQYHNVTPHEFFDAWDPGLADALDWGRRQLRPLARRSALGLGDSAFNEGELRAAGFAATAVVPVLVDVGRRGAALDSALVDELRSSKRGTDWLFVGRLAPNKAQHELVKAFAQYRRVFDAGARLWLVGGDAPARYRVTLERFVAAAGLGDAVRITGPVSDADLLAYYAAADVLVCLSRHEGFGVPLLEAMAHGVPVVARASSAVTETVHDAGVLLPAGVTMLDVAAAVWRVASDRRLRDALVAAGRRRAAIFSLERSGARLLDALRPVLGAAA